MDHLIAEGQEEEAQLKVAGTYATSRFTQLVALARKFRLAYWRSPSYNLTRMLMTLLICLFYGTVFWGRGRVPATGETHSYSSPPVLYCIAVEELTSQGWANFSPRPQHTCSCS